MTAVMRPEAVAPATPITAPAAARDPRPQVPTREAVAKQIRREIRCHTDVSFELVDFFAKLRDKTRKGGGIARVSHNEWYAYHDAMLQIMPDEAVAKPGSAHDLLNRHLLDPSRGELAFRHTTGHHEHEAYCGVVVEVVSGPS